MSQKIAEYNYVTQNWCHWVKFSINFICILYILIIFAATSPSDSSHTCLSNPFQLHVLFLKYPTESGRCCS